MTEKRFKEIYPDIIRSNYCFTDNGEPIGDKEVVECLNALHEENQVLKRELQNIYDIATLNKAVSIIEKKYDDYLYDKDVDCIPCKRKAYLECIELLDDFRDDLE